MPDIYNMQYQNGLVKDFNVAGAGAPVDWLYLAPAERLQYWHYSTRKGLPARRTGLPCISAE